MILKNKNFVLNEMPNQLRTLKSDQEPKFGLMSAQHMVEHLAWSSKMYYRQGEPEETLNKSQLYFQKFLSKGCPFEYRLKEGQSKADLRDLKYGSMDEAVDALVSTCKKFYELAESNPEHKSYSPVTGEFTIEELDTFIGQHLKWHAYQFGLEESYEPAC